MGSLTMTEIQQWIREETLIENGFNHVGATEHGNFWYHKESGLVIRVTPEENKFHTHPSANNGEL